MWTRSDDFRVASIGQNVAISRHDYGFDLESFLDFVICWTDNGEKASEGLSCCHMMIDRMLRTFPLLTENHFPVHGRILAVPCEKPVVNSGP